MQGSERFELSSGEVVAEVIAGEAVIINLASGTYYSLAGAGGLAWAMLAAGHTESEVAAALADRYGVDPRRAGEDVRALLAELRSEELLVPAAGDGPPGEVGEEAVPASGEYDTPELRRYDDMRELLAVDPPMPQVDQTPWRPGQD